MVCVTSTGPGLATGAALTHRRFPGGLYKSVRLTLHQKQGSPDTLLTGGHWPVPRPLMTRSPLLTGGPSLQVEMSFTARGKLIPINFHRLVQLLTLRPHWNKAHHSIIPRLPHIVEVTGIQMQNPDFTFHLTLSGISPEIICRLECFSFPQTRSKYYKGCSKLCPLTEKVRRDLMSYLFVVQCFPTAGAQKAWNE